MVPVAGADPRREITVVALDPLIRLVNLFELLSTSKQPLTQEAITDLIPGFPESPAARARAFERAKASLREIGIPVRTVALPGRAQVGYWIDPDDFAFDLDLTRDEWAALEAALGCAVFVGQHGQHFESRLGLLYRQVAPILWDMGGLTRLDPALAEAIAGSKRVRFGYRGRERDVFPFGVLMRWGQTYLVAEEEDRQKSFRIDRIEGPYVLGPYEAHPRPIDLRSALPSHPWHLEIDQRVQVTLLGARAQLEHLGATPYHLSPDPSGLSTGVVEVSNMVAFFGDLMMESAPVVPIAPPEVRVRFMDHVKGALAALQSSFTVTTTTTPSPADARVSTRPPPPRSHQRLEDRFMAVQQLLSYLRINGGSATIKALTEASGLPADEVVELLESASLAGLPPYSPDVLLDVMVDEEFDLVEVSVDTELGRTKRIDVVEAMTVLATLDAVAGLLENNDPELTSASRKLRSAIEGQFVRVGDVVNLDNPPESLALLRRAVVVPDCVEFAYTDAEGKTTTRHAVALTLFVVAGRWYLFGLHEGKERHFRLDRMREVQLTPFDGCHDALRIREGRQSIDRLDPLGLRSAGQPTRLRLRADQMPTLEALTGGVFDVEGDEVIVYSFRDEWLARLLLALGPGVRAALPSATIEMFRNIGERTLVQFDSPWTEPASVGLGDQGGGADDGK